jgi:hypothetical protein
MGRAAGRGLLPRRQLPHDRPRLLDVPRDLRLELLDAGEALLAAQLLVQGDFDALAVELEVRAAARSRSR